MFAESGVEVMKMSDGHESLDERQPDIGAILEGLRTEVRARRLAQAQAEPSSLERELRRALDEMELYRVVSAHWPLLGKTVPQRVIALVNKLVRRYLRWYINPIVEQQNHFNAAVVGLDALDRTRERELARELAELRARVAALEEQLAAAARADQAHSQ